MFAKVYFMFCTLISIFVRLWQRTRSLRMIFNLPQCRFYPSCSDYLLESLKVHGLIYGMALSIKRLIRCNPLFEGGIDQVHSAKPIKREKLEGGSLSLS